MADSSSGQMLAMPPVQEMAMGVIFHPVEKLSGPFFGIYWQEIKSLYPKYVARPAAPAQLENMNSVFSQKQMSMFFGMSGLGEMPQRYVFSNEPSPEVVQIQRDLFTRGWVRRSADQVYPEYETTLRPAFELDWDRFLKFATSNALGEVRVRQCEVTYINVIARGEGWDTFADLPKILVPWGGKTEIAMPAPEAVSMNISYSLTDAVGRVVVSLSPGKRAWDEADSMVLTVSARVMMESEDPASTIRFLDTAHGWARRGFEACTSRDIRELWKRGK